MNMRRVLFLLLAGITALRLALAASARADEIWLKDGSPKIVRNDRRLRRHILQGCNLSYGFAMVRKDSILEILPGDAKPAAAAAAKAAPPKPAEPQPSALSGDAPPPAPAKPLTAVPVIQPAVRPEPQPASFATPIPAPVPRAPAAPAKPVPPPALKPAAMPAEPMALAAPAPVPPVVQEFVRGKLYINQTWGFQMFRPPGWELVKDAAQNTGRRKGPPCGS